jgi:hypothetical protein
MKLIKNNLHSALVLIFYMNVCVSEEKPLWHLIIPLQSSPRLPVAPL